MPAPTLEYELRSGARAAANSDLDLRTIAEIELAGAPLRLLATESLKDGSVDDLLWGADAGWLVAGPLLLDGAHGDLRKPLGVRSWSSRPWDQTACRLDGSMQPTRRRGAELVLPAELGNLWAIAESAFRSAGACLRVPNQLLEAGVCLTEHHLCAPDDDWVFESAVIPPGMLGHLFLRCAHRWSRVGIAGCTSISTPQTLPPGVAANLVLLYTAGAGGRTVAAGVQAGATGPWYVPTNGQIAAPQATTSSHLEAQLGRLELGSRVEAQLGWPIRSPVDALSHEHRAALTYVDARRLHGVVELAAAQRIAAASHAGELGALALFQLEGRREAARVLTLTLGSELELTGRAIDQVAGTAKLACVSRWIECDAHMTVRNAPDPEGPQRRVGMGAGAKVAFQWHRRRRYGIDIATAVSIDQLPSDGWALWDAADAQLSIELVSAPKAEESSERPESRLSSPQHQ